MTDIQPYLDRLDITLTEYPEDPWGKIDGPVFGVKAKWRDGAPLAWDENSIELAIGRASTRDDAVQDFCMSLARRVEQLEADRRRRTIYGNPTSVERIIL